MQKPCISGFLYSRVGSESLNFDCLVKLIVVNGVCFFDPWSHSLILCFPTRLKTRLPLSLGMFCEKSALVC